MNQYESSDFEIIYFQLKINETLNNFIYAYNPYQENKLFFEYLEIKFLMTMDLALNFFFIGDFNDLSTVIS